MNEGKVIPLKTKVGRNEPCPCGSGKKYKSCCMRKDQEEESSTEKSNKPVKLTDKFFSVDEYIKLYGYPLIKFDFFLLEMINIMGDTIYRNSKLSEESIKEVCTVISNLGKEFYIKCESCKFKCQTEPYKSVSFKNLIEEGLNLSDFPENLKKQTRINYFYNEFMDTIAANLEEELNKIVEAEDSERISGIYYWNVVEYISNNCYERCDNDCVINCEENAYCNFCNFGASELPCPLKGEVSYEAIKATEEDIKH